MALVTQFTCPECRRSKTEAVHPSHVCVSCRTAKAQAAEDAHMAFLVSLPMEERIRRVELALYRLDAESRLKALESIHSRY